ncbi:uncharacterized protein LY89DRAFT_776373 [Mollisia scopiformis]|uniref:N-acetyltransferase domain-containing protein n=1 Tax=Mollisia scopiformis TaxID=149040 RepID=A0A194XW27_MOLSC|nr:uncharacterized protein LY89DRAFT_776373 [Mollisia scopiformis]KUJ24219.1 hypothetical protein LY89DRAFT_776373 [Mollisia scopiformis]
MSTSSTDAIAVEAHTSPLKKTVPKYQEELIVREARRLWDGPEIGRIAATTYMHTRLSHFVAPKRYQYPQDWERGFVQRAQKRLLDPRSLTFVLCTKSNPDLPVGYATFVRLGNDKGARKQIESHSRLERIGMWIWSLLYGVVWFWIVNFLAGGDKSEDKKGAVMFVEWGKADRKIHWDGKPERENRWHALSVVVREEYQGRKGGKRLMTEIIGKAEAENVVVGLESSPAGEMMYRSVGFELLGRFSSDFERDQGGVMMYTPKARR